MLTYLAQGLGYGFAAAAQPGPFQTYVISQSLRRGWRRALPAALAPLISDGPIILAALLVLNRLPSGWQDILYVAGGLFVLYLAWGALKAWREFQPSPVSTDLDSETEGQSVLKAAAANALSPGPYLFWGLVTGPILLRGWRDAPVKGVGFLVGFYTAMVGSLVALVLVFGVARRLGPKVNRALVGLSAVALAVFGVHQVWQGIF
ncbi:MAG: LysE family translocator [Anaerolineae bacterium]